MHPTCSKESTRFHAKPTLRFHRRWKLKILLRSPSFCLVKQGIMSVLSFGLTMIFVDVFFLCGVKFKEIWKMDSSANKKDLVCHPLSWTLPLKSYLPNGKVVFQPSSFRGYMNLREGIQFTQVYTSNICQKLQYMFVVWSKILKTALSNKRLINPINTLLGVLLAEDVPGQIGSCMRSFQDHFDRKGGTSRRLALKKGFDLSLENPINLARGKFWNSMFMI